MATLTLARPADLQIPKLVTTNYRPWKELTTTALSGRGVWEHAEGTSEKPSDENKKDQGIWRQNDVIAVGIIKGSLSEV